MTEQGLKTKFLEYFVSSAFAFHHHSQSPELHVLDL